MIASSKYSIMPMLERNSPTRQQILYKMSYSEWLPPPPPFIIIKSLKVTPRQHKFWVSDVACSVSKVSWKPRRWVHSQQPSHRANAKQACTKSILLSSCLIHYILLFYLHFSVICVLRVRAFLAYISYFSNPKLYPSNRTPEGIWIL